MEIKWSKIAVRQLEKALDFIIKEGFAQYATELQHDILLRIENLTDNYNIYQLDKYKTDNDGTYHAFEVDDYRISYRVINSEIRIIRIRHTSRKTIGY